MARKKKGKRKKRFKINKLKHRQRVAKLALNRRFPFDGKKKFVKLKRKNKNKPSHKPRGSSPATPRGISPPRAQGSNKEKEDEDYQKYNKNANTANLNSGGGEHQASSERGRRLNNLAKATAEGFKTLELQFCLDIKTIKSAHRRMALKLHPDKGGNKESFVELGSKTERIVTAITAFLNIYPECIH